MPRTTLIWTPYTALQYIIAGLALAEVAVILAQRFPSPYSARVLSLLGSPTLTLTPDRGTGLPGRDRTV